MLREKIFLQYFKQWFLPLVLGITLLLIFIVYDDYNARLKLVKQTEKDLVNLQLKVISKSFEDVLSDIRYMENQYLLKTFLADPNYENRKLLELEYLKFAESKRKYLQIRIIDSTGWEQIRIDNKKAAKIIVQAELQNKKHRGYFRSMMALKNTEVYVSEFDLNIEHKKIEIPYVPVVRIAVALSSNDKAKRGGLILNYLGDLVLQDIVKESSENIGSPIFINKDGGYMLAYEKNKEWDFIIKDETKSNFQKDYPQIWPYVREKESGQIRVKSGLFTFARVHPFNRENVLSEKNGVEEKQEYCWNIISYIPDNLIRSELNVLIIRYSPIYVLVVLLLIFFIRSLAISKFNKETLLLEQEERLKMVSEIINIVPTPIFLKNSKKEYILCNEAFLQLTGRKKEDVIGKRTHDVFDVDFTSHFLSQDDQAIQEQQAICVETKIPYADGKEHDVILYKLPIPCEGGNDYGIVATITDITEIKENERKLMESENTLKILNATKNRFFSIIAHDLRNPLNVVHGFSGLLAGNYESYDDKKRISLIKKINEVSQVISEMLENLLNWARSQSEIIEINKTDIDVTLLVNKTASFLESSAEAKDISFNIEIKKEVQAFADADMIETVIRNIISNSIKYTKGGGKISVSEYDAKKVGFIGIKIKDTGVGISAETIKELFEVDRRFKTPGTNNELGTGLGLLLCKEFIDKNDGEIWVESTLGKGSSFYFTLPQKELNQID